MNIIRARWMPVYIEPIPFSGERICAAIAFRSQDGEVRVVPTMPDHATKCLFGSNDKGMNRLVSQITDSLGRHMKSGADFLNWIPPFERVFPGEIKSVKETSMDAAIKTIVANVASMANAEEPPKNIERSNTLWAKSVEDAVKKQAPTLLDSFNVPIKDERDNKIIIGFINGNIAAEFAALNIRNNWSTQSGTFFRKLVNLKVAASSSPLIVPEHLEVLMRTPNLESMEEAQKTRYENLLWDAEKSAHSLNITTTQYSSADSAANHLRALTKPQLT